MKKTFTFISIAVLASLVIISCKKSSTPSSAGTSGGTPTSGVSITSPAQVSYSMGGTNYSYISNNSTLFSGSSVSKNINTSGGSSTDIFTADIDDNGSIAYLAINKGTLLFTAASSPDSTAFKNFITTGTKSYSNNAANGIEITMTNSTGTWSTSTGSQTGSTFSIDAIKETWSFGTQYMKFKASFSCKLYDASGLNPKTITNGVFVGEFGNI